jgi:hypothetical protein
MRRSHNLGVLGEDNHVPVLLWSAAHVAATQNHDLTYLWALPALLGGFLLFLFIIALAETRMTLPYMPAEADAEARMPQYVRQRSAEIRQAGFEHGGMVQHAKVPQNDILGTIWLSPARDILVVSGAGTVLRMPTRQTWLFTPLNDGRVMVTTDQNDEGDPSGLYITRRLKDADFPALLTLHRRRLEGLGLGRVRPFTEPSALEALLALYARRVDQMVRADRARYVDMERSRWKHTWKGGVVVCANFFVQLGGAITQFWRYRQ